jgi:hypothetical protein
MVHFILKYLMVIGVVLQGFQQSAFADEKDKDKEKDKTTATKTDSIIIKVDLDILADDTLVFDDYDEDDDNDKGDNSIVAFNTGKTKICIIPLQNPEPAAICCSGPTYRSNSESDTSQSPISEEPISIQAIKSKIYPNPATKDQTIWITHNLPDKVTITVSSMSGQVIRTLTASDQKVNLDGLSSGMYLVGIAGNGLSESKRLLVQ